MEKVRTYSLLNEWYKSINYDRSLIKTILVVDKFDNKIKSIAYDISKNQDGSIKAYLLKNKKRIVISNNNQEKILVDSNLENMFSSFSSVRKIEGLEKIDVSNTTNFNRMFYGCRKLKTIDLSSFDTRKAITMNNMLLGCNSLRKITTNPNYFSCYPHIEKSSILENLDKLGYIIVSPETGSMEPLVKHKVDQVVFFKKDDYKKNDIVLYSSEDATRLIMHRIKRVLENGLLICGDATFNYEYVEKNRVFAVAKEIYKNNKKIKCNSLKYKLMSFYSISFNKLLYRYRKSNHLFWKVARKTRRLIKGVKA